MIVRTESSCGRHLHTGVRKSSGSVWFFAWFLLSSPLSFGLSATELGFELSDLIASVLTVSVRISIASIETC